MILFRTDHFRLYLHYLFALEEAHLEEEEVALEEAHLEEERVALEEAVMAPVVKDVTA